MKREKIHKKNLFPFKLFRLLNESKSIFETGSVNTV